MSTWQVVVPSVAVACHWYLLEGRPAPVTSGPPSLYDELMEEFMSQFEKKRTAYDRWGTWIFVLLLYTVPLVALIAFCLPRWRSDLALLTKFLTRHSQTMEIVGYAASLGCAAAAKHLPQVLAIAGLLGISRCLGRIAALIFSASAGLSASLRGEAASPLQGSLHALVWGAQAVMHQDDLAGIVAMSAALVVLLLLLSYFDPTPLETISDSVALVPLIRKFSLLLGVASSLLMIISLALGVKGCMTLGAMCCGHLTALLALLSWSLGPSEHSLRRQTAVLAAFMSCLLAGLIVEAPSLRNAGASSVLLWFWVKCLEAPWANLIFKIFMSLVMLHIVRENPALLDIMNPQNLYAA